ncbi:MAG: D-alanyl-D-alanine carboxypeptidase, partial [Eubacterium sp.]|nr:D-alanyl-D-alanine carboxypeptidase [Eubacterium sp.]
GYEQGAAMAGFLGGETVPIRDLLYGTMLPSGAEACTALANIVAGSEADFVTMMNAKAQELGMNTTNFVNCTGLFDVNHVSSCADLAILLQTALQNSDFRSVFTTHVYTCTPTSQHATGLTLNSTLFSNLSSSTLDNGTTIEGGKTGYTDEAGRCLASMAKSQNGTEYILVTTGAFSDGSAPHISDAITIYSQLP